MKTQDYKCQTNTIPYTETARVNVAHNKAAGARDPLPAWPPATALPRAWLVLSRGHEPQVAMSHFELWATQGNRKQLFLAGQTRAPTPLKTTVN